MTSQPSATRDDVLRAFAVDFGEGPAVLSRYLTDFPQYAVDLVDLSRELTRSEVVEESLTEEDVLDVRRGLDRFRRKRKQNVEVPDLQPKAFLDAAKQLNLPLQVMMAFRERRVELVSVPIRFRCALADALRTTRTGLENFLALPPQVAAARANKSSVKPVAAEKVSFERILIDAAVASERVAELIYTED